ncbi:MAG: ribose-phosphate pyrophosphokinase [Flavobacteriales bacterium]|nr:MAG: ribose-phosphate pyrophosphokinase [Flavobacteriales bacterium]
MSKIQLFSGRSTIELAEKISAKHGTALGNVIVNTFSDGEFQPSFEESVRGADVFIIQSTVPPADNLMELLMMVDAAKRASANRIVAIMPYFGLARQDRKDKPRVPIGAKLVAKMMEAAGVTRVMTMDLHADQIQGFFEVPVDHLFASTVFIPYIKSLNLPNIMMASPDMGGTKRANAYAKHLDCGVVVCYKQRKKANIISDMFLIGEVKGKDVIIVDDMVDTAGTLTKAADLMMENGATSVRAMTTHPILSGDAYEKIENSKLTELIVTDTIPLKKQGGKIKVISVADLFANIMKKVTNHESISEVFIC